MKPVEFRCNKTVVNKIGKEGKCGKFLCSVGDRITLVCRKCGTKYALAQEENGYWRMTKLATSPIRVNDLKKEQTNGQDNCRESKSLHPH